MILETALITPAMETTADDFATFGAVHLDVTDGARALAFWHDLVGLERMEDAGNGIRLGAGGRELVVLHPGANAPTPRKSSGLYHLALHLPSLTEFARVVGRVHASRYPHYPTDHVMSLADYLDDPDGIGLELTFETPQRMRSMGLGPRGPEIIDADGQRRSGRDPIDLAWLFAQVPDGDTRLGLPTGTFVGHVHLKVADVNAPLAFYRDVIGFTPHLIMPELGSFDMSAGGSFPHRLAGNTWESAGRPQRPSGAAGLRYVTLVLRSADEREAAVARVAEAGSVIEHRSEGVLVADPSGNRLLLTMPLRESDASSPA
jgi:catechol 2,3-dioxygenase